jgi:hypothetical protein
MSEAHKLLLINTNPQISNWELVNICTYGYLFEIDSLPNMKKYLLTLLIVIASLFVARPALASSSLSLTPSSGTFGAGSTMKVNVYANTGGENVNAVQANVAYPPDKLQFLSISTGGSALTIFAEKYATGGVVRLAGGTPSPGFSGNKLIASISFKVLQDTGTAGLSFTSESAVLRDSDNANTLSGKGTGSYTLGKATATTSPSKTTSATGGITISNVVIESVTTSQAIITWKTDIKSDSTVEYGKDTNYGFSEPMKDLVTDHRVVLANYLLPGTTYHFHVRSADAGGKEGVSDDATFITKGYDVLIRIKDAKGNVVSGATVTLYSEPQQQITTDANGEAHFLNVAPGKHGVIVKENKQTMIHEIEVVDGQPVTTVDLVFSGATSVIPMISTPVLYGLVGFVVLLVIALVIYVIVKNRGMSPDSDTPMSSL